MLESLWVLRRSSTLLKSKTIPSESNAASHTILCYPLSHGIRVGLELECGKFTRRIIKLSF